MGSSESAALYCMAVLSVQKRGNPMYLASPACLSSYPSSPISPYDHLLLSLVTFDDVRPNAVDY